VTRGRDQFDENMKNLMKLRAQSRDRAKLPDLRGARHEGEAIKVKRWFKGRRK
jgi:hypothetical protein